MRLKEILVIFPGSNMATSEIFWPTTVPAAMAAFCEVKYDANSGQVSAEHLITVFVLTRTWHAEAYQDRNGRHTTR